MARIAQLALVGLIIIAAFVLAPANRGGTSASTLLNQDERVAQFADAAASALASLEGQSLDTGFLGTDRGELFVSGGEFYERSIADALVELDLVDSAEAQVLESNGIRLLAIQCQDRVGVLGTSATRVPDVRRAWWDDNRCDERIVLFLPWPVYIALSDESSQS